MNVQIGIIRKLLNIKIFQYGIETNFLRNVQFLIALSLANSATLCAL